MSPLGTTGEKFHLHMVRSRVSFSLVRNHPTTAVSKKSGIWITQKNEAFFLDFKKLSRKLIPQFLSLRRFFLLFGVLSNEEHSDNNRSQHILSYGPGPVPCGSLKPPFTLPSTLESRYRSYPIFRWENPGPKRWSVLPWVTWLANLKIWLLIHTGLYPKPTRV